MTPEELNDIAKACSGMHPQARYAVDADTRWVRTTVTGPFALDMIVALEAVELRLFGAVAQLGNWKELILVERDARATPEFIDYLSNNHLPQFQGLQGQHAIAIALVIPPGLPGAKEAASLYRVAYKSAGMRFATFDSVEDAEAWLHTASESTPSADSAPPPLSAGAIALDQRLSTPDRRDSLEAPIAGGGFSLDAGENRSSRARSDSIVFISAQGLMTREIVVEERAAFGEFIRAGEVFGVALTLTGPIGMEAGVVDAFETMMRERQARRLCPVAYAVIAPEPRLESHELLVDALRPVMARLRIRFQSVGTEADAVAWLRKEIEAARAVGTRTSAAL